MNIRVGVSECPTPTLYGYSKGLVSTKINCLPTKYVDIVENMTQNRSHKLNQFTKCLQN